MQKHYTLKNNKLCFNFAIFFWVNCVDCRTLRMLITEQDRCSKSQSSDHHSLTGITKHYYSVLCWETVISGNLSLGNAVLDDICKLHQGKAKLALPSQVISA